MVYPLIVLLPFPSSAERNQYIKRLTDRFISHGFPEIENLVRPYPLSFTSASDIPPLLSILTDEIDLFVPLNAHLVDAKSQPRSFVLSAPPSTDGDTQPWRADRVVMVADDPTGETVKVFEVDEYILELRQKGETDAYHANDTGENRTKGFKFAAEYLEKDEDWAKEMSVQGLKLLPEAGLDLVCNLDVGNMVFETWAGAVDDDGIFRDFKRS